MRYAKSIKHGGMLVEASDCDHSSYVKLGLCCPFCGNPVFLSKGRDFKGSKKRKAYKTAAYFSHFKGVEAEECELRSTSEGKARYAESRAKAKQQRLSKFQSAIAFILELNPKWNNWELAYNMAYRNFCIDQAPGKWQGYLQRNAAKLSNLQGKIKKELVACLNVMYPFVKDNDVEHLNYLAESKLEQKLHGEICQEVVSYLFSPGGKKDLFPLMAIAIYEMTFLEQLINTISFGQQGELRIGAKLIRGGLFSLNFFKKISDFANQGVGTKTVSIDGVIKVFVDYIMSTPWASGFELLAEKASNSITLESELDLRGFWLVTNKKKKIGGIVIISDDILQIETVNFQNWWQSIQLAQSYSMYRDPASGARKIIIRQQSLPVPINDIQVTAEICAPGNLYGGISEIALTRNREVIGAAKFWLRLDDHKLKKKYSKELKIVRGTKDIFNAPCLYLNQYTEDIYSSLLMTIFASYIVTAKVPLAEKLKYMYPQLI